MVIAFPLDGPTYNGQMIRNALSALAGLAPSGRPLGATSGVRPGTPSGTVALSGTNNFTWTVQSHSGVIDVGMNGPGPYLYWVDGSDTGTITAANATNPRIDIIYVQVNDNTQDASGSENGVVVYLAGTPASSPVAPTPPTARGFVLANINVPAVGGGNPSASWVAPTFGQAPASAQTLVIGPIRVQWGSVTLSGSSSSTHSQAVTFATAFSATPTMIQVTGNNSGTYPGYLNFEANAASATGFTVISNWADGSSHAGGGSAYWLAIGAA